MNQCKYCGGMGCQACRYGEGFESVDLIESYLEAQSPQAAANKAAEEGGLPAMPKHIYHWNGLELVTVDDYRRGQHAAIAADRASRQVANKAEVDDGMFSQEWKAGYSVAFEAAKKLFATPPATTGASTAQVDTGSVARAWNSLADKAIDILQRNIVPDGISDHDAISELLGVFDGPEYRAIGDVAQLDCDSRQSQAMTESKAVENLAKVGASTVLTDERIIEVAESYDLLSIQDGGRVNGSALLEFAREVAAQAGQVAVPDVKGNLDLSGITSVVLQDRGSKSVIVRFGQSMAAATKFLDQFGTLVLNDRAAPSPAKESK